MPSPRCLVVKNGSKILAWVSRSMPQARIPDGELAVIPGDQAGQQPAGQVIEEHAFQLDFENTALVPHGVNGIGADIEHHLLHLNGIGPDVRRRGLRVQADIDGRRNRGPQESLTFPEQRRHVDHHLFPLGLPAKGENLFHEVLGPIAGVEDRIEVLQRLPLDAAIEQGQLGIPHDHTEDIIEIMGDPPRQRADGLQFLGLHQLIFHGHLLGDVPHDRHVSGMGSGFPRGSVI